VNLDLTEDQVMLKDALMRALAKVSTPAQIRASEATGHDAETWKVFVDMGLPLLRVSEAHGGADGSLMDAVVVAEIIGEMVPVIPAVDVMVAARLLAQLGADVADIGQGAIATLALNADAEQLNGVAAVADRIVFKSGDSVRIMQRPFGERADNIGSMAMAPVAFGPDCGVQIGRGAQAVAAYDAAIEEWKLLNAAAMAAAAKKAILNAADYAKERHAFDQPIGSYQGLAHPIAEAYTEVEGAQLLIWRTVEALSGGHAKAGAMVRMSAWWAAHVCRPAVTKAMRVFGGYGMANEYDAQLFFRRVNHMALIAGTPDVELQTIADRLWANASPALPDAGDCTISFEYPQSALDAAAVTRRIFEEHATPEMCEKQFLSDDGFDPVLYRKLGAENVLHPDWPVELGGSGSDSLAVGAINGVFVEYDWDRFILSVANMLGKLVMKFGSDRAKAEILPGLVSGATYSSLGFSEPSCGSDIFAAKTKAERDGDDWIINGQKMWTSQGHFADYALMLVRTGEGKHNGITLFALPIRDCEGFTCNEIKTVGNERTNATFYDNVRISDDYRLGDVNGGAKVLGAALAMEQGSADHFVGAIKMMLEGGLEWANRATRNGKAAIDDPATRAVLASVATRLEVTDALSRRTTWSGAVGKAQKHFGPAAKLFGSEAWVSCSADLMAMAAPDTLLQGYTDTGRIERQFRRAVPSTIYAGSSEVQRSIVAEAGLGLPRTRS
jgi:3-oxochol-4-en-24-oyl-CoA dehydrogenase